MLQGRQLQKELWQAADQPTSTHRKKWMRQRKVWKVMRGQVQKLSGVLWKHPFAQSQKTQVWKVQSL